MGLLYYLLGLLYNLLFFSLEWVCFTICCLGLMLGFFSLGGLALLHFFFCLKVEQIILFIYLRVFLIFFKG